MLWKEFYSEPVFLGNKFTAISFTWYLEKRWSYHILWKESQPGFESSSWESENSAPKRHQRAGSRAYANAGSWPLGDTLLLCPYSSLRPKQSFMFKFTGKYNLQLRLRFSVFAWQNYEQVQLESNSNIAQAWLWKRGPGRAGSGGDGEKWGWGHPTAAADSPPGSRRTRTS